MCFLHNLSYFQNIYTQKTGNVHEPFTCMVWNDKKISSQFAKKRPGKILIYVLNISLNQEYLPAEILEKCERLDSKQYRK